MCDDGGRGLVVSATTNDQTRWHGDRDIRASAFHIPGRLEPFPYQSTEMTEAAAGAVTVW